MNYGNGAAFQSVIEAHHLRNGYKCVGSEGFEASTWTRTRRSSCDS